MTHTLSIQTGCSELSQKTLHLVAGLLPSLTLSCTNRHHWLQRLWNKTPKNPTSSIRTLQRNQTVWMAAVNCEKHSISFWRSPVSALGFARTLVRLSKNTKKIPWMTRTLIDVLKDAKKLSIIGGVSALWGVSEHHKKSWYVSLTSSYVDVWIPTLTIRELYRVSISRFSHFT